MNNNIVRFGIIGTNGITDNLLSAAKKVEEFKLTAVYSRKEETAKDFAKKYNVNLIFTDLEEMASSNEIDAVYIASPNALHSSQAILFMKNKKHVLCEKAFASNVKEVEEMIKVAKENNVVLMEAMKITLLPNFKAILDNVHKIGKVRRYFASYCKYSSRYDKYKEGIVLNAFKKELSNGSLMDIGVYTIAPMVALFGKPNSLKASAYMLESGVDGEGSIIAKYPEMECSVMYSKISDSYLPSEIQGEEGSIIIDHISRMNDVKIVYRDGREEIISIEQDENDMFYEVEEFISLVNGKKKESEINSLEFSKNIMSIMDEARKQIDLVYEADLR